MIAEVLAALKSILDDNELREFTKLSKHKKEVQLLHMSKIISGIRLFNKDCGKGGNGIPKRKNFVVFLLHFCYYN